MELENTLNTGTTAKIKKLRLDGKLCVIKIFRPERDKRKISKETLIHKSLKHTFIIQYLNDFLEDSSRCIAMEYCPYSLRALIEQSHGLAPNVAHLIFVQLIAAVKYIHSKGICHRDIKPENILIGYSGNIKLSDFGCGTLYFNEKQRRLKNRVGSPGFMAPEVLLGNYDGAKADIWSCGITLLNMLTGKMPWEDATRDNPQYSAFCFLDYHHYDPFSKVGYPALSLIKGMLKEEKKRMSLEEIENHSWFNQPSPFLDSEKKCKDPSFLKNVAELGSELYYSQPDMVRPRECFVDSSMPLNARGISQIHRFYLSCEMDEARKQLAEVLEEMAVVATEGNGGILFNTTDTQRNRLTGEIILQRLGSNLMLTIRKSAGSFQEFQKFVKCFENYFSITQV